MIAKEDIRTFCESNRVLLRANDFIYLLPHPALRNWISNYTITFPNKNMFSNNYAVIPHGSATLVFSCDGKGLYGKLFGPATQSCTVGEQANQLNMLLIIEFQPAGLYIFTGAPQKELANHTIPFGEVNSTLSRMITEVIDRACNLFELVTELDRLFLTNLYSAYPSEIRFATQKIIENMGNISLKELSESVYYSERQLNRIFDQYLGMNTKTFSRLVRINKAIRLMHNSRNSLTCVSDSTGFYDLPHFIRDFKSVCGITPQEYCNKMSDFYNEIAKF